MIHKTKDRSPNSHTQASIPPIVQATKYFSEYSSIGPAASCALWLALSNSCAAAFLSFSAFAFVSSSASRLRKMSEKIHGLNLRDGNDDGNDDSA